MKINNGFLFLIAIFSICIQFVLVRYTSVFHNSFLNDTENTPAIVKIVFINMWWFLNLIFSTAFAKNLNNVYTINAPDKMPKIPEKIYTKYNFELINKYFIEVFNNESNTCETLHNRGFKVTMKHKNCASINITEINCKDVDEGITLNVDNRVEENPHANYTVLYIIVLAIIILPLFSEWAIALLFIFPVVSILSIGQSKSVLMDNTNYIISKLKRLEL